MPVNVMCKTHMQPGLISILVNPVLNLEVVTMPERSLVCHRQVYQEDITCKCRYININAPYDTHVLFPFFNQSCYKITTAFNLT